MVVYSFFPRKKDPGGRNAAVHPGGVSDGRGKRGQSERAAANEDVESSGARKMGRPAFHPPPEAKGEGKGARSRAREGSEGGRGSEVGSVRSQPCAPTASLVMLFALFSPLTRSTLLHLVLPCVTLSSTLSRYVVRSYVVFPSRRHPIFSTTLSTFCVVYSPAEF